MTVQRKAIEVLHIVHSFDMGGMENGLVNLINESDPAMARHKICCITRSGRAGQRLKREVDIYEMGKEEFHSWRFILRLSDLIRKVSPDIVHTRTWGAVDGIFAARLANVGKVIHGEHGWAVNDPNGRQFKRRAIRRISSHFVNKYIAVSEDIREWLIQAVGIKEGKIVKIINGVDTQKFRPGNGNDIRRKLGFSENALLIGTVGRLDPIKDQQLLLRAFGELETERKNLQLIMVGGGPENVFLESLTNTLPCRNRVSFLGRRDDIETILQTLDLFVLTSKNEGMSNTILEAMATGLPIIATAVGGNPEIVSNGKTGVLFPSGSLSDLIEALNFYVDNPEMRKIHGKNAREKVELRFSLSRMVKEYEALYKDVWSS